MTYLQMLRLKYGILNEADDDEEDKNKKNQNNEEEIRTLLWGRRWCTCHPVKWRNLSERCVCSQLCARREHN